MDQVLDVTDQLDAHKAKYDAVTVEKLVPLEFDLRCLAAFDQNPIDDASLRENPESYLKAWSRDGAQLLVNAIFGLETESTQDGYFAKLPEMTTKMPRAKPIPKAAPKTRWEKFAAQKGIQKKKRSNMVVDEVTGESKPRFGYDRHAKNKVPEDWLIEVPDNADPMEDQYEKRKQDKKKRVDKNKMQQRRNAEEAWAESKGIDHRQARKMQLTKLISESKTATASLGRFDKKLEGEGNIKIKREKRKFESNTVPASVEKESQLQIAEKIGRPKSKTEEISLRKAVHSVRSEKRSRTK